ncbi:MAG: aminotransferase class III-fold pyridoxal phosphate-dependent enzyme [Cyclobacteriaceae bacterium]|nr:aminotransferase class III-fold pyridoxal phosphate-dependent enzyme [Cyclobacteriaceae bacterium]
MKLFDVYPLLTIHPVKAEGAWLWDDNGNRYLDLYGGHAVISIGHAHPRYIKRITEQLNRIAFYSNSVQNRLQQQLADLLGELSGYPEYQLFLVNSGAEAVENALKVASFVTGRKKIIAFGRSFHGRTSGAVAVTDNAKIAAPFNQVHQIQFLPLNDHQALRAAMNHDVAAVIVEGIQGLGGIHLPDGAFLQTAQDLCREHGALLILDEIQSGYGRTGKFFAHQHAGVQPHLIVTAKGMGNGFPIGGVLIHPDIKPWPGMLGTTFGGSHLACAAALAVLEVIRDEQLMRNAHETGGYLIDKLNDMKVAAVRGMGLMIGLDVPGKMNELRNHLVYRKKIFTGESKPDTIRLLPPLSLTREQADMFLTALADSLQEINVVPATA